VIAVVKSVGAKRVLVVWIVRLIYVMLLVVEIMDHAQQLIWVPLFLSLDRMHVFAKMVGMAIFVSIILVRLSTKHVLDMAHVLQMVLFRLSVNVILGTLEKTVRLLVMVFAKVVTLSVVVQTFQMLCCMDAIDLGDVATKKRAKVLWAQTFVFTKK